MTDNHVDFEGAKQYALERLTHELAPTRHYHSLRHTRDDVVPATIRLAELAGVTGEDRLLLVTAAYFHDVGHIECSNGHEAKSAALVREVLPGFGYSPAQIDVINGIIMATKMPQNPHTLLEQIMADADLDSLGRDDFLPVGDRLREELVTEGQTFTDEEWYRHEIQLLENHSYFTEAARRLRNPGKQRNLEQLHALLAEIATTPPDEP